jgi:hypothetical protein
MERIPLSQLKTLQILHLALSIGPALFLGITFLINTNKLVWIPDAKTGNTMLYIGVGIAVLNTLLSTLLYRNLVSKIDTSASVTEKLQKYTSAFIVRCALLEGAALFNTAEFLITGCLTSAVIAALLIIYLISFRPTREKVVHDLMIQYPDNL